MTKLAGQYDPTASPPSMTLVQVASRELGPTEVRIDVRAVPISRFWLALDTRPFVPGWAVAGYVAEIGRDVLGLAIGERVAATHRTGGLAEEAVVPLDAVRRIPDDLPFELAVGLTGGTKAAFVVDELLDRLGPSRPARTIGVIHDGAYFGAVAAGLLRETGATVIGLATSPNTVEFQLALRYDAAVDLALESVDEGLLRLTDGRGVDAVIDQLGRATLESIARVLRPNGCFVRCDPYRTPLGPAPDHVRLRFDELGATVVEFAGIEAAARSVGDLPERVKRVTTSLVDGTAVPATTTVPFEEIARIPALIREDTVAGSIVVVR